MWNPKVISALSVAIALAAGCGGQAGEKPSAAKPGGVPTTVSGKVGQFAKAPSGIVKYPTRLAVAEDGTVYVSDVVANAVYGTMNGFRVVELTGLDRPLGLAVRGSLLYVGNQGRQSVEVYDLVGMTHLRTLGAKVAMPNGIAVAPDGTAYVADSSSNEVKLFGVDGSVQATWGGLKFPVAVALDGDRVYVADQGNHRVVVFDRAGKIVRTFGSAIPEKASSVADFKGRFTRLQDIAVQGGEVLVLDSYHSHVQIFDAQGQSQGFAGSAGDCATCVRLALGIAIDHEGKLLATDPENARWIAIPR